MASYTNQSVEYQNNSVARIGNLGLALKRIFDILTNPS